MNRSFLYLFCGFLLFACSQPIPTERHQNDGSVQPDQSLQEQSPQEQKKEDRTAQDRSPLKCPTNTQMCSSQCIDAQSNSEHCGRCNNPCKGGSDCLQANCKCPVDRPFTCDGACTQVEQNPLHCGKCNNICPNGQKCIAGACKCKENLKTCSGACTDLSSDPKNCGKCGTICSRAQVCSKGTCRLNCPPGSSKCDGACVSLRSNSLHCGQCRKKCPNVQTCNDGRCSCARKTTFCNDKCVNILTNPQHCGSCGTVCSSGPCKNGSCNCPSGQKKCNHSCTDLQSDPVNCGGCNNKCKSGQRCIRGKCTSSSNCPSGQKKCGSGCIDLKTSALHCGQCGKKCLSGQNCSNGICTSSPNCPTGQHKCSSICVDLKTSYQNCGKCGLQCPSGRSCKNGSCVGSCPSGKTLCQGHLCVDLKTNPQHCGGCGNKCFVGKSCSNGTCKSSSTCDPSKIQPGDCGAGKLCYRPSKGSTYCVVQCDKKKGVTTNSLCPTTTYCVRSSTYRPGYCNALPTKKAGTKVLGQNCSNQSSSLFCNGNLGYFCNYPKCAKACSPKRGRSSNPACKSSETCIDNTRYSFLGGICLPKAGQSIGESCNTTNQRCLSGLVCYKDRCLTSCARSKPQPGGCSRMQWCYFSAKGCMNRCDPRSGTYPNVNCLKDQYCNKNTGTYKPGICRYLLLPKTGTKQLRQSCSNFVGSKFCDGSKNLYCNNGTCINACNPAKGTANNPACGTGLKCKLETRYSHLGGGCK